MTTFKVSKVELCQVVLPKATVLERLTLQDDLEHLNEKQRERNELRVRPSIGWAVKDADP